MWVRLTPHLLDADHRPLGTLLAVPLTLSREGHTYRRRPDRAVATSATLRPAQQHAGDVVTNRLRRQTCD